jgi:hypothetical protein
MTAFALRQFGPSPSRKCFGTRRLRKTPRCASKKAFRGLDPISTGYGPRLSDLFHFADRSDGCERVRLRVRGKAWS